MDSHSSSLSFELRIIKARNIYLKSSRDLFIRCYIPSGRSCNKRVRLDSHEISSNSNLVWNQTFSLDCSGNEESIKSLKQGGTVVLELRCRNSTPLIARMSGSKLLARAEMPWNDVMNMEIENWVVMTEKKAHVYGDDVKPPAVQIGMKVEEYYCGRMESGCNCCNSCHVDYEFYASG